MVPVDLDSDDSDDRPDLNPNDRSTSTGVEELDTSLGGGFPHGHTILLAGPSGSGKTIFSFQWLFDGIRQGQKGLYITMTEPLFKSMRNIESMRFYDEKAIEDKDLIMLDMRHLMEDDEISIERIVDSITEQVVNNDVERVCIDSITALAYLFNDKAKIRRFIFELGTTLATIGCTTILTSETPDGGGYSQYGVEEFISDSILQIRFDHTHHTPRRELSVVKIRGRNIITSNLSFEITENGINAFKRFETSHETPHLEADKTTRVSMGNKTLDQLVAGGVYRGSTTLVSGPSGTGKTLIGYHFLDAGLTNDEDCLLMSFEESQDEIFRTAEGFSFQFREAHEEGNLHIESNYAGDKLPDKYLQIIENYINEYDISRIVIDSLSALRFACEDDEYRDLLRRLNSYLKYKGVTAIMTSEAAGQIVGSTDVSPDRINAMADNIIMLRFAELEGRLQHIINVVKMRGSGHSKGLHTYDITDNGMWIGPSTAGYEGLLHGAGRKVSETAEEDLEDVFRRYIGPMSSKILDELGEKGLSEEAVMNKISEFSEKGILQEKDAEQFKKRVREILNR